MNLKSVTTRKKKSSQALFIKESAFYTILSRSSARGKKQFQLSNFQDSTPAYLKT
tara:strand:+ start:166 stop:330 length:165 start_codon:yes stop_codon:yes gene_type:complete